MKTMTIKPPLEITPRLMPGLHIGGAFISMGDGGRNKEGLTCYGCFIDLPDGTEHEVTDLKSGCGGAGIQDGLESLLSFLGAAAESYRYRGMDWDKIGPDDNATLFPKPVTEWAHQNSDEISMMEFELRENENLIEE